MDPLSAALGLGSVAAGVFSAQQANSARADLATQANEFSAGQFATRYQTTVADMKAAGLSPMLAYGQGGGSPPSGQMASASEVVGPAVDSGVRTFSASQAAKVQDATVDNIEADSAVKRAQAELVLAQTGATGASADKSRSDIALNERHGQHIAEQIKNLAVDRERGAAEIASKLASIGVASAQVEKIRAEITNLPLEGARLLATAANLAASSDLMRKQGRTQEAITQHVTEQARKAFFDADISALDLDAMKKFDNLGNEVRQLKPIFDIMRGIFRPR